MSTHVLVTYRTTQTDTHTCMTARTGGMLVQSQLQMKKVMRLIVGKYFPCSAAYSKKRLCWAWGIFFALLVQPFFSFLTRSLKIPVTVFILSETSHQQKHRSATMRASTIALKIAAVSHTYSPLLHKITHAATHAGAAHPPAPKTLIRTISDLDFTPFRVSALRLFCECNPYCNHRNSNLNWSRVYSVRTAAQQFRVTLGKSVH